MSDPSGREPLVTGANRQTPLNSTDPADAKGEAMGSDTYQEISWGDRAAVPGLGAVIDPADAKGYKNRYIDRVHRLALQHALRQRQRDTGRPFRRALDFGCGTGRLLGLLTASADAVFGVDRTPEMLARATASGVVPADHLVLWRDGPLPFEPGYFDLFISVYVTLTSSILDAALAVIPRVCSDDVVGIFIEQVDVGRSLTVERYRAAFSAAGFQVDSVTVVRRGARSVFLALARLAPWPRLALDALARMESASLRGHRHSDVEASYFDYVFVVTRRADTEHDATSPIVQIP